MREPLLRPNAAECAALSQPMARVELEDPAGWGRPPAKQTRPPVCFLSKLV